MDDMKSGEEIEKANNKISAKDPTYHIGEFSLQRKIEKEGKIVKPFKKITSLKMNDIPTPDFLDDIWFYMNYRLNFYSIFKEEKKIRLNQHLKFLNYVHTKTAPDNAIVIYFLAYVQFKLFKKIDNSLINKIIFIVQNSDYWSERFEIFNLSVNDLTTQSFPDKKNNEFMEIKRV